MQLPKDASPDEILEHGRAVLAQQPFSVLLGAHLAEYAPGHAVIVLPLRPELMQQMGFAHGGVVSYLADNALTYAGGSAIGAAVVTSEMKINYVRPGIGQELVARAQALYTGASQAVCQCRIFARSSSGQEKLCALAQGTIVRLPPPKKPS